MKRKIAQILLSAFLIFHVAAIFILPNPDSILFRQTEKLFVDYGNTLGINTTWRFFSPNPLIRILEYQVTDAEGTEVGEVRRFPVSVEAEGSRESFNRKLNYAMYMLESAENIQDYLGPYLCRQNAGAVGLTVYSVARDMPTVEAAQTYSPDSDSLEKITRSRVAQVDCTAKANE